LVSRDGSELEILAQNKISTLRARCHCVRNDTWRCHSDDRRHHVIPTTAGRRNLSASSRRRSLSTTHHLPGYPKISTLRARCHCVRSDNLKRGMAQVRCGYRFLLYASW